MTGAAAGREDADAAANPAEEAEILRLWSTEDDQQRWRDDLQEQPESRADARMDLLKAEVRRLYGRVAELGGEGRLPCPGFIGRGLRRREALPPGMTAMQAIAGQWPGDETQEELLRQLKEIG